MTRVGTRVELDDALLGRIDDLARQLGSTRDQLIEESLRREVAGRLLEHVFEGPDRGGDITSEDAEAIAYRELDAMRAERDRPDHSP